jgi:hypothetical protein
VGGAEGFSEVGCVYQEVHIIFRRGEVMLRPYIKLFKHHVRGHADL